MERLKRATQLAGLDLETIDTAFLIGGLAKLAAWYEAEKYLNALGKESICTGIREDGQAILSKALEIEE